MLSDHAYRSIEQLLSAGQHLSALGSTGPAANRIIAGSGTGAHRVNVPTVEPHMASSEKKYYSR